MRNRQPGAVMRGRAEQMFALAARKPTTSAHAAAHDWPLPFWRAQAHPASSRAGLEHGSKAGSVAEGVRCAAAHGCINWPGGSGMHEGRAPLPAPTIGGTPYAQPLAHAPLFLGALSKCLPWQPGSPLRLRTPPGMTDCFRSGALRRTRPHRAQGASWRSAVGRLWGVRRAKAPRRWRRCAAADRSGAGRRAAALTGAFPAYRAQGSC